MEARNLAPAVPTPHVGVHRHSLIWLAVFVVIALMFLQLPPMVAKRDAVFHTYSALVEVDAIARQQYVEPVTDDRLVHGAIRGMMFQLDPYSGYIAPDDLTAFERRNRGDFIGVGVEVGIQRGEVTVIAPIEGSPAAHAGIVPGDVILAIDRQSVEGLSVFDVEDRLTGAPGTAVRLLAKHPRDSEPRELQVVRGPVTLRTVRGWRRDSSGEWDFLIDPDHGIGYVRVSNFLETTSRDVDAALAELRQRRVRGLILDLRFNPGGLMPQAVAVVDQFIDDGLIVSTVTRRRAVHEYRAGPGGWGPAPALVVLINGASASASEIVAGSLQARGRGVIVGERSFGKGSVQHLIHLMEHKAAVKLTTAYYRLPDGRIIHRTAKNAHTDEWGVRPDVAVELTDEEADAVQSSRRQVDIMLADGDRGRRPDAASAPAGTSPADEGRAIVIDRQLQRALALFADDTPLKPRNGEAGGSPGH